MQFLAIITAAFAAVAFAAPAADADSYGAPCTPATYSCTNNNAGWQVCNTSGAWVFAGNCPPKTTCHFNYDNQSPYCI